jgi:hypothetical protein
MTHLAAAALDFFLVGSSDPDASLGGAPSTTRARSLAPVIDNPIPALIVERVLSACGEGSATLEVDSSGDVVFTPPGGAAGTPVSIAAGSTELVTGTDTNKGILLTRDADLPLDGGPSELTLVDAMNGFLGMSNVSNAQRAAGVTTYRAAMLTNENEDDTVQAIKLWFPASTTQATYSIATEDPSTSGSIQTIADENTAPTGVSWVTPTSEATALEIASLAAGDSIGIWIRRVFPVGTVAAREDVQLAMSFKS